MLVTPLSSCIIQLKIPFLQETSHVGKGPAHTLTAPMHASTLSLTALSCNGLCMSLPWDCLIHLCSPAPSVIPRPEQTGAQYMLTWRSKSAVLYDVAISSSTGFCFPWGLCCVIAFGLMALVSWQAVLGWVVCILEGTANQQLIARSPDSYKYESRFQLYHLIEYKLYKPVSFSIKWE